MGVVKIFLIVLGTVAAAVTLLMVYVLTDFTRLLAPLTPIIKINESKLTLQNGIVYKKDEPFTGTSVYRGYVETYPVEKTTISGSTTQNGKRVIDYKNGLKDGKEKLYYTYYTSMFGMLGGPDVYTTRLHCEISYKNGVKNGVEIINYVNGCREVEATYADGVLHGIYKEYHYIDDFRKSEFPNRIGPLRLEAEYDKGQLSGFYRTYTQYGDTSENYVCINGKVLEGCKRIELDTANRWEWYKDGKLIEVRLFNKSSYGNSSEPPSVENSCGGVLLSETFYDNDEFVELRVYDPDNRKMHTYKKRINGELVEVFNRSLAIDRRKEFGLE